MPRWSRPEELNGAAQYPAYGETVSLESCGPMNRNPMADRAIYLPNLRRNPATAINPTASKPSVDPVSGTGAGAGPALAKWASARNPAKPRTN
jgi:hypothetical protein